MVKVGDIIAVHPDARTRYWLGLVVEISETHFKVQWFDKVKDETRKDKVMFHKNKYYLLTDVDEIVQETMICAGIELEANKLCKKNLQYQLVWKLVTPRAYINSLDARTCLPNEYNVDAFMLTLL